MGGNDPAQKVYRSGILLTLLQMDQGRQATARDIEFLNVHAKSAGLDRTPVVASLMITLMKLIHIFVDFCPIIKENENS